jgi:hypothetical protein
MEKRCNMRNVFFDFNKYNVIPTTRNMDIDGGRLIHKRKRRPRECLRGAQGEMVYGY